MTDTRSKRFVENIRTRGSCNWKMTFHQGTKCAEFEVQY